MEQWQYDPAADLDPAFLERIATLPHVGMAAAALRSTAAFVIRHWLRVYHRLTILGQDNLPRDGSFVMIANHASHLDTLCLMSALPAQRLHQTFPAAARDYFCSRPPFGRFAAFLLNAVPFDRQFAPWRCLGVCSQLLQSPGNILILFPEGTRGGGREPRAFKPGIALLAAGRDVPVVPCHISGAHAALPKGAWYPRPAKLRVAIGTPLHYTHRPATKETAKAICQELREAVMSLAPST